MLLDPFEKQFDLPAAAIKLGNRESGQREIVGKEHQCFARLRIFEADSPQRCFVILERVEPCQHNGLIADKSRRSVDWMRVATLKLQIRLGADNKEAADGMKMMKSLEIEKPSIHDVKRSRFWQQIVENIDLVHLAVADMDKRRNIASQIEQRVQLDGCLGFAKGCPREHRQTKIDSSRVEGVDRVLQIDAERFVCIKLASHTDQALSEVGINSPVARRVGIRKRIARYVGSNPEVIQSVALHTKTGFDVPKALPESQLRKRHAKKLIQTGERFYFVFSVVPGHATAKRRQRQMLCQLSENQFSLVHSSTPRSQASQRGRTDVCRSNRDQEKPSFNLYHSIGYGAQRC